MRLTRKLAVHGLFALMPIAAASHAATATDSLFLSQCDGCTAEQAKQMILAENALGPGQRWYSIDGAAQQVLVFDVVADAKGADQPPRTERRDGLWVLNRVADDHRADGLIQPLLRFYRTAPVGWEKTIDPGANALFAKILKRQGIAHTRTDSPTLAPYQDPAFNVWNTVDEGSAMRNRIVDYVQASAAGNIADDLGNMFGAKAWLKSDGVTVTLSPGFKAKLYASVQFADESTLSLSYTEDGWVTDPRFGKTLDSNGNAVPITTDQIAPPNGIHAYDFRPKSWPTNANDRAAWAQRVSVLTGGTAAIDASSPMLGCTSVGRGPIRCRQYLIP